MGYHNTRRIEVSCHAPLFTWIPGDLDPGPYACMARTLQTDISTASCMCVQGKQEVVLGQEVMTLLPQAVHPKGTW